jgi:hypothetical protein
MLKDVFEILAGTPDKLRREIQTLSSREMRTRPHPNKWSIQIILAHLADVEQHAMRGRIEPMLEHDVPTLAAFDQGARVRELHYERKDPRRTLASFARLRHANLKWLRKLKPADLKRRGNHEVVGQITVGELLNEWAFHDLGHLKQILEIKRYFLYPRMGNMKKFYQLS